MTPSDNLLSILQEAEGCRLEAYQDIAGIWTIGYGHTGPDVRQGRKISQLEAETLLFSDATAFMTKVKALCKREPAQCELEAMTSLAYNIGINAFRKSTVLRKHNAGDRAGAAAAFAMWNKARVNGKLTVVRGLVTRRAREADLYLSNVADTSGRMVAEAAPEKPVYKSKTIAGTVAGAGVTLSQTDLIDNAINAAQTAVEKVQQGQAIWEQASALPDVLKLVAFVLCVGLAIYGYLHIRKRTAE